MKYSLTYDCVFSFFESDNLVSYLREALSSTIVYLAHRLIPIRAVIQQNRCSKTYIRYSIIVPHCTG